MSFAIKFVTLACKVEHLMEKLTAFIDKILYEVAIPIMMITQKD
jgi:hypothetical protein